MRLLIQAVIDGLAFGGVFAIGALGFRLIYSTTQVFHIAYGSIGILGAYLAVTAANHSGVLGLVYGMGEGALAVILVTAIVYLAIYAPLERRGGSRLAVFVASLGVGVSIEAIILWVYGPFPQNFPFNDFFQNHPLGSFTYNYIGITAVALAVVCLALVSYFLERTRLGREIRAYSSNRELSELVGVRTRSVLIVAYAFGAALSLIASVLLGMLTTVVPTGGPSLTLLVAIAVIGGGIGSYLGSFIAGLAIGLLQTVIATVIPGDWVETVIFALFLATIVVRPSGLFGRPLGAKA
jgi:branched-chain amino acid transport system permease protein